MSSILTSIFLSEYFCFVWIAMRAPSVGVSALKCLPLSIQVAVKI